MWVLVEFIPRDNCWIEKEGAYKTEEDAKEAAIEWEAATEHEITVVYWTRVSDYTLKPTINTEIYS